ncbi:MAG: thioredoxin domain-containing protein, partial [Armatimonadota bacterium]|nr:thioredoxin domain-containing protein [Armatimonadota bacterium]
MSSRPAALFVTALVLAGMASCFTAGCRAAETQADAQTQAADAADTSTQADAQTVESKYMGLSSGPLSQAIIADLPEGVVVQSGDLTVTREEIDAFIDQRATTPEAKAALQAEAFFVAEQLAVEPLLEREAKQWAEQQGQDPGAAVIDAHLQHIAEQVTVSDEDVRAFYDANKDMVQGAPYEQIKEQLRSMVLRDRQQNAVTDHINGLSKRQEVRVDSGFLAEVAPKAFDNPVDRARRSGKPTFVDFGSEGCYACDMMAPIIEELQAELGDRVNVVLIQVPEEQYLSARYGIRSIPVQYIYDEDGR